MEGVWQVPLRADHRARLAESLRNLLAASPGCNKRQLLTSLRAVGWTELTTTDVNSVLYEHCDTFEKDDSTPPRWMLKSSVRSSSGVICATPAASRHPDLYAGPPPRPWQEEALEAWQTAGRRGVVEAVTGTGKTAVGVLAAADALARGLRVVVVVPGRDLLDQWYLTLLSDLPRSRTGRLGDGHHESLADFEVLVATVQSACRLHLLPARNEGLLIADEVHHYGAEVYSRALQKDFSERLGLTATYERTDDGITRHLRPYFAPNSSPGNGEAEIVAGCDYERGLAEGILSRFRVALVGVDFRAGERESYQELDETARKARADLINRFGCQPEPYGEFMREVNVLSEGGFDDSRATRCARRYLNAFSKRRALLADCSRKLDALEVLGPLFVQTNRALVFTETVESAERAAARVRRTGVAAHPYTSRLDREERKTRLHEFRRGKLQVLAAPRVLDEGVDVPEADLGVILAASHSRRQMVQRMGRIIRPSADGRPATFVVLYVRGTSEDPDTGAHEAFLEQIVGVADEVVKFPEGVMGPELWEWYGGG